MELGDILPIIVAILFAIGLPIAMAARRRGRAARTKSLHEHLNSIGVKASPLDERAAAEKVKQKLSWGEKCDGICEIQGRNIDYVSVTGVSSQYGTNYYLNYLVKARGQMMPLKKTTMFRKKSPPLWGKVVDIGWDGDPTLSHRLDLDYSLKHRLLQGGLNSLKGDIAIIPEPKHAYIKIKTNLNMPSPDLFEAIDSIAKHVRAWT